MQSASEMEELADLWRNAPDTKAKLELIAKIAHIYLIKFRPEKALWVIKTGPKWVKVHRPKSGCWAARDVYRINSDGDAYSNTGTAVQFNLIERCGDKEAFIA